VCIDRRWSAKGSREGTPTSRRYIFYPFGGGDGGGGGGSYIVEVDVHSNGLVAATAAICQLNIT